LTKYAGLYRLCQDVARLTRMRIPEMIHESTEEFIWTGLTGFTGLVFISRIKQQNAK
jgi:hypothetical protein